MCWSTERERGEHLTVTEEGTGVDNFNCICNKVQV